VLRGFLVHSDICYFFEPAKAFLHESLLAGRLALWSPYIFCGYPIGAEGQIATFYPLSLLISWLLPSPGAINWLIISHLLLAGISMYLLARSLALSPFAAWLSGFVFSFSGYLFAHLHHVSLVCAAAWLPLTVLFVERAWQQGLFPNGVLAALTWAASALCGHPQTVFHISLLVVFWVIWRLVESRRSHGRWPGARPVKLIAVVFVLGAGLAAVQLFLTAELAATSPHGQRGSLSYITSFSLLPEHLFGLINPNWEGSPAFGDYQGMNYYWEYVLYIGLLPLTLAVIGALTRRALLFAAIAAGSLALALAEGNPLYQVLRFLPGFSHFRVPARYVLLFTFAAALLAAQGWRAVARWRWLAKGHQLVIFGGLAALLAGFDLLRFDRTLSPLASPRVYAKPDTAAALQRQPSWWRAFIQPPIAADASWLPRGGWAANPDGWAEARACLSNNVPQSYRLRRIGGYAGFIDPKQAVFFRAASIRAIYHGDPSLLALVGVRYFAVAPRASLPGTPAEYAGPFAIYRHDESFPRVFVVTDLVASEEPDDAHLRTLELARAGRLRQAAIVQGSLGSFAASRDAPASLRVEEPRPERVLVHARADGNALLVLNERWAPGWRAYCDGRAAPVVQVDTVLIGTPLPKGNHDMEFVYRPRGLVVGRAITLLSLVVCVALLFLPLLRRRRGNAAS